MTRVVVAMSGGVDSSVSAALLLEEGYEVIGVMMRLWSEPVPPAFGGTVAAVTNRCCTVEAVHDARSVAERLGIPFYVINVEDTFRRSVVDLFIAGYTSGQTPNPCLACNRHIRFGHLLRYARSLDAAYLATGHYAQVARDAQGRYQLCRGADRTKDQSYVLSVLGQDDLAQVLFPVGRYTKPEVRVLAAERGLPTASRADSQDLCFIADGDYRRFLADHAADAVRPGPILDRTGRELGRHRGLPFYTVGQRSGLGIAAPQPLYVLALDAPRNALIVGPAAALEQDGLWATEVNWVSGEPPSAPFCGEVQIRYHAAPAPARITPQPDGEMAIVFDAPLRGVTPGQAAVIYDGEVCLGGGIIQRAESARDSE